MHGTSLTLHHFLTKVSVVRLNEQQGPWLSICALAQVPPNYDSLLGKLIVWGEDRTQAIARMKRALNELVISGVPTTTQYHEMILEIEDFVNGNVDTGFIPKHADQLTDPPPPKTSVSAAACRSPSAYCVPRISSWQFNSPCLSCL